MITLAKALLLHKERVFHQAACLLSRAFWIIQPAIFQNQLLNKLSAKQADEKTTKTKQNRAVRAALTWTNVLENESVNVQKSSLVFGVWHLALALLLKHVISLRGKYTSSPFKVPFQTPKLRQVKYNSMGPWQSANRNGRPCVPTWLEHR